MCGFLPVCGPTSMAPPSTAWLVPSTTISVTSRALSASPSSTSERTLVVVSVTVPASLADTSLAVSAADSTAMMVAYECCGLTAGVAEMN